MFSGKEELLLPALCIFVLMTVLKIILIAYAFVAVFVSGGLFFQHRQYTFRLLSVFTLLLGWEMLYFVYCTSPLLEISTSLYGRFYFESGFLYGPVLWFHLQFFLNQKKQFSRADVWHLLPFFLAFLYYFDIAILPDAERLHYTRDHFYDRIMPLNYARALHQLIYGAFLIHFVRNRRTEMSHGKRSYTYTIVGIYFLTSVLISWLTAFAGDWDDFVYYYLIVASIVFLTGYLLYQQPDFLVLFSKKYLYSGIEPEDMIRISRKITTVLRSRQLYLDNQLQLKHMAQIIGEKPHHISQTFSLHFQESFNDHINRYRVEHAMELLRSPDFQNFTIEALALDSGFNNKMTFNKFFRKFSGMKPSEFRLIQSVSS